MRLSLHAKGVLAFSALVAYVVVVSGILGSERQNLLGITVELQSIWGDQAELARTEFAIHHVQLRIDSAFAGDQPSASLPADVALDLELVHSGLLALQKRSPQLEEPARMLADYIREARLTLTGESARKIASLHERLGGLLDEVATDLRARQEAQWAQYHRVYDWMTFVAVSSMVLAALVFGAMVSLFFSRIAWDIGKLEARALDIVGGFRGEPIAVTRDDEIGGLMQAVNRMQSELRRHEMRLELARQQRFHQEKMAAIGSLAAAVAHEINNPIAAIAGIAQSMAAAAQVPPPAGPSDFQGDGPQLILEQAQRISAITRQIAEFSRPHPPRPELTDLNRLVRSVCTFTSYDRRLRSVDLELALDPAIPAVDVVADHVTQVLMNLLLNAGDALGGGCREKPAIRVSTRLEGDRFLLSVADNGAGMDEQTLARVFEEGFSTKPSGQGLGLFLCRALVEQDGGRIAIDASPGAGTTVSVHLPVARDGAT